MQEDRQTDLVNLFTKTCRKNNLRVTPQRLAIYKEVLKSNQHPTAEEIYQTVKNDLQNI